MAVLTTDDQGALVITGSGKIDIDPSAHLEIMVGAISSQAANAECSLPELYPALTPAARDAIAEVAATHNYLKAWFDRMKAEFAAVGAADPTTWTRKEVNPAWCRRIRTWMIDEVIKGANGTIYVRLSDGGSIKSEAEFELIEGKGIEAHLDEYLESTRFGVEEIKAILRAPLVTREVTAVNKAGATEKLTLTGPNNISIDQWAFPPGYTLMEN